MDLITKDSIRQLAESRDSNCVSMYLPTERAGREVRQNALRLKNLLKKAEEQLQEQRVSETRIRDLLKPAHQLVDDNDFWQHQSDGLALFLSKDHFRRFRLPLAFDELAMVTNHFYLKPLFPLVSVDGRFYVLALSQNQVRVLQGSRFSVSELDVAGVPASLAEALKFDDPELSLQLRQGGAEVGKGQPGFGRAAVFHGHGAAVDAHKDQLLRYFQQIDHGLQDLLAGDNSPLILAGVDYYFPIYREASSYNYLLEKGIEGNPEHLDVKELHAKAWQIVEPVFQRKTNEAKEDYQRALSKDQASGDVEQVVRAAGQGRVGILFVSRDEHQWGVFDREDNSVRLHDRKQSGDEDLLDHAALQTFSTGGSVYVLERAQMPADGPIAAIYRY